MAASRRWRASHASAVHCSGASALEAPSWPSALRDEVPAAAPHRGFIVDFCCPELKLVLELDGCIHGEPEQQAKDQSRQEVIEAAGVEVLRLQNDAIASDLEATLDRVRGILLARLSNRSR